MVQSFLVFEEHVCTQHAEMLREVKTPGPTQLKKVASVPLLLIFRSWRRNQDWNKDFYVDC